jgi:DNA-binding beta-propeller fold protein YncE
MCKFSFYSIFVILLSCTNDKMETKPETGYPDPIADIIVTECAVEGCHNSISRYTSAGLDFSTWELMFEGGRNGTSVIPYSPDYSFMLYTINTDTSKGPTLEPTMPYLRPHLSDEEYNLLFNWIRDGAPDKNGFVKFSDNPTRRKAYICMQGCDKVAVIDAATKIIMRYIDVGEDPNSIEAPHQIVVSPDGNYWYAVFVAGRILQKFRTSDDALVATLQLDNISHNWNTIIITPDGSTGFVNALDGRTQIVNLDNMSLITFLTHDSPHGGFVSMDGRYLYLTCQTGNFIYKIDLNSAPFYDQETKVVVVPGQPVSSSSPHQPHEAQLAPDGTKYFVSCQGTNEVRAFQTSNDSLLAVIPVGAFPQEFSSSVNYPYIFVSCTEEPVSATQHGSVYAINYNTLAIVSSIYTGFQPHGIAVDDTENLV